ncbi:MAG: homoserine dehydrogenase [Arenicella sp.]|jgi:homoserine dehydrogenase
MNTQPRVVLKFGGSVLSSPADFARITSEIQSRLDEGSQVIAVLSAYFGVTEQLISQAKNSHLCSDSVEYAELIASGEFQSASDLSNHLIQHGFNASYKAPSAFSFIAQGMRDCATPISIDAEKITIALEQTPVVIMPGFSAIDAEKNCILLGRGGSDISAVYIAQALKLECVRLLKDVDGLYDVDPNKYANAKRLSYIDYQTAGRIGGELIQTEAINFAASKNICIDVAAIGESSASRIGPKLEPVALIAVAQ